MKKKKVCTLKMKKGGDVKKESPKPKYRVVIDGDEGKFLTEPQVIELADQLCACEAEQPDITTAKQAVKYLRMEGHKVYELMSEGGEISPMPFVYKKKESCGCKHSK